MKLTSVNFKRKILNLVIMQFCWVTQAQATVEIQSSSIDCRTSEISPTNWPRSKVYQGMPFQAGEEARYELKYGLFRIHVGYGFMRVGRPIKHRVAVRESDGKVVEKKLWHRKFSVEAYTGDWYKAIFKAHDKLLAFSRPWDFGVSKFYIKEDHDKAFGKRSQREKWLDFDHATCQVQEKEVDRTKGREKDETNTILPGVVDALGAAYRLRTYDYKLKQSEKFAVYTSGKNWYLEAKPVAEEIIETKLGKFPAIKLLVETSLGQELEQKGAVTIWVAAKDPHRQLLRIEGEAKFGQFYLEIDQFKAGKP